jgi:membrane-bound serine protease (ClpP class)
VPSENILTAVVATFGGLLGGMILLFVAGARLSDTRFFKRIALTDTQDREQGYTSTFFKEPMKGKTGTAFTILRPAGKVMIDGQIYDATTRGEYIEKGQAIEVLEEDTTSLRVKHL